VRPFVWAGGIVGFVRSARCAPRLTSLLLGGPMHSLDDEGLAALAAHLPALHELDLSMHKEVGPVGIAALAACPLRRLRISRNELVTPQSLAQLAGSGHMRSLVAVNCTLARKPQLRQLQQELQLEQKLWQLQQELLSSATSIAGSRAGAGAGAGAGGAEVGGGGGGNGDEGVCSIGWDGDDYACGDHWDMNLQLTTQNSSHGMFRTT